MLYHVLESPTLRGFPLGGLLSEHGDGDSIDFLLSSALDGTKNDTVRRTELLLLLALLSLSRAIAGNGSYFCSGSTGGGTSGCGL